MQLELNPRMETLFLMMIPKWDEEEKAAAITELDGVGLDGRDFYNRHYRVVEKYYTAFLKEKKDSPGTKLAEEMDEFLLSVYADILWKHPHWFENLSDVPDEVIRTEVGEALDLAAENSDNIIMALESLGLSAESKWQIMVLSQQPRAQLVMIISAINENLPAFEKARAKVSAELDALLTAAGAMLNDTKKVRLWEITSKAVSGAPLIPTLALPVAVLALDKVAFFGLLSDKVYAGDGDFSSEELLGGAKAISERSKLEILLALKGTSLYSLEIADCVDLTAATVSHHMSGLLALGFVTVERREGRMYYRLAPKEIERFLRGAAELLL